MGGGPVDRWTVDRWTLFSVVTLIGFGYVLVLAASPAVAERIHRDTAGEIEITLAIGRDQPGALAALETEIGPGEYGKQMRRRAVGHGDHCWVRTRPRCAHWHNRIGNQPRKTKRAAFSGQHVELFYAQGDNCQPVGGGETRKCPVSRKQRIAMFS